MVESWSLGTAYAAFVLLAVSLMLGPLNVLRRKHNPVHSSTRRDVGVAAGIAGLVHTGLGLQVHVGGEMARYFIISNPSTLSGLAFVASNYIGLVSALTLVVLLAISNNAGVRFLGLQRWKKVQRIAYLAASAAAVHGLLYQLLEKQKVVLVLFVTLAAAIVILTQLRGFRFRRDEIQGQLSSAPADRR